MSRGKICHMSRTMTPRKKALRGSMKLRKSWRFEVTPTTLDVQNIEGCNEVVGEGLFIPGCVGGSIDHRRMLRAAHEVAQVLDVRRDTNNFACPEHRRMQ